MEKRWSVRRLEDFGRERLSPSFFMRDFLHSEIAAAHGLLNAPDDPELCLAAGWRLCGELLEPLQARWGRVAVRSGYRSPEVNALGNRLGLNCASNEKNFAKHIWDRRDAAGHMGATACLVLPAFWDAHGHEEGGWRRLAEWVHAELPYGHMHVFPKLWAFNIGWHEKPERRIDSYAAPRGRFVPEAAISALSPYLSALSP